jgi:SAM-dependent methyltransferase
VARLRTRLELRRLPYDELKQGSALAIAYPDNTFDKVFSHGVLHHIPDIRLAEREIARVLKPGGELGLGMSLYAKRLERGRFLWPSSADGVVTITPAQLGYLLEGIDWRMPQRTWRPQAAG